MSYRKIDKISARSIITNFEDGVECSVERNTLTTTERELRGHFSERFYQRKGTEIPADEDLKLGLILYTDWLSLQEKIDQRMAADDDFWRNLTCCVLPDYVLRRWPAKPNAEGLVKWNADRYYNKPQRNWFKIIWWMCHLSWQGDKESTEIALRKLGNDAISQIVERTGQGGYRVDLYRAIVAKATSDAYPNQASAEEALRRAMKLNTMRTQTTAPEFYAGGIAGYVDDLFLENA
jgi:hypothetical protein